MHTHLKTPETHAEISFEDLSSTFNTMISKTLADMLTNEFWVMDVQVSQRRLFSLCYNDNMQGCFITSTSCISTLPNRHFTKYVDNSALVSLLNERDTVVQFYIPFSTGSISQTSFKH